MATAPILITVTTLWSYTALFGHALTPSTAFTALQLLAVLQGPLQQFPNSQPTSNLSCVWLLGLP